MEGQTPGSGVQGAGNMPDYKEKIRKLLALAESPNGHEAKAALLKARQIMAEQKITEAELQDAKTQAVKDELTSITYSVRRNPWIDLLSAVIGENYCCRGYRSRVFRKQTNTIGFIGLENDVEVCVAVFEYAVEYVSAEIQRIKEKNRDYSSDYVKWLCDGYGYGFAAGVEESFQKQQAEQDWGLVLTIPKEVKQASQHLGYKEFNPYPRYNISGNMYAKGYSAGKEFNPAKYIGDKENDTD